MEQEKLNAILNEHKLWLFGNGGKRADLQGAYLRYANLQRANLQGADLQRADLRDANLQGADLQGANLRYADLRDAKGLAMGCPEEGSFIAFKQCRENKIVKLEILSDAKRSSATGRKCRCDKARVLSITSFDGLIEFTEATSQHDPRFGYSVGEIISVDNFDENRWNECAAGIHFFITRQEAVEY